MINLKELPAWSTLTVAEKSEVGRLSRLLEASGAVQEWRPTCVHQIFFFHKEDMAPLYALDSLLCALTHADSKYALRALLQARGYLERKSVTGLDDTFVHAQIRVERMLF